MYGVCLIYLHKVVYIMDCSATWVKVKDFAREKKQVKSTISQLKKMPVPRKEYDSCFSFDSCVWAYAVVI